MGPRDSVEGRLEVWRSELAYVCAEVSHGPNGELNIVRRWSLTDVQIESIRGFMSGGRLPPGVEEMLDSLPRSVLEAFLANIRHELVREQPDYKRAPSAQPTRLTVPTAASPDKIPVSKGHLIRIAKSLHKELSEVTKLFGDLPEHELSDLAKQLENPLLVPFKD